jgi:lipid-A-disaccharide synthase-like uncharacterized protein
MDPVFIAGQAAGLIIYGRNVILILRERKATGTNDPAAKQPVIG